MPHVSGNMECKEAREQRRQAVRTLSRLATAHSIEGTIYRDVGAAGFQTLTNQLLAVILDPEERAALVSAHKAFAQAIGATWAELAWPTAATAAAASTAAAQPSQAAPPPAATPPASAAAVADAAAAAIATPPRQMRVQGRDIGLTFNHAWVPEPSTVEAWWPTGGVALATAFQQWALTELPGKFRSNTVEHISLTIEESLRSSKPKVHLHAQITFHRALDLSTTDYLCFGPVRPHVEVNHARGKEAVKSRARAHFYVVCLKEGSLWHYTDWIPFCDYPVDPLWLTGWWAMGKLSHKQYRSYLLKARRCFRTNEINLDAVTAAERAEALQDFRAAVAVKLSTTKLPFRLVTDPLFPKLPIFMDQYQWAQERYLMYALQGPSQAAKTSFAKTLFKNPFVVTCQGAECLNLNGFRYGEHGALVLDNIVDLDLILQHRALLQANTDEHRLGESATGIYSYSVFLWAVPIIMTIDMDVDAAGAIAASEWLSANVLRDMLPRGATCYVPGNRQRIPIADMPKLQHAP